MPASIVVGRRPASRTIARQPGRRRLEGGERVVREARGAAGLVGVAQRLRDRVAGAVADLEQPLARRAAAAREPVAAVLARERAAELLEPVDRARRVADVSTSTSARIGGLVRRAHDVLGVQLRRVVVAERRLDPALRLRRVVRLERSPWSRARRCAPARSAATAAASPAAPLPITSTSNRADGLHPVKGTKSHYSLHYRVLSLGTAQRRTSAAIESRHGPDRRRHAPRLHRGRPRGHARRGRRADDGEERRRRRRQGLRPPDRDPHRARHAEGDGGAGPHERGARAAVDDGRPGHRVAPTPMSRRRRG